MRVSNRFFPVLVAALGLLSCAPSADEVSSTSSAASASATDPGNAGGNKLVTVMTRNLYLGADLGRAFGVSGLDFLLATTTIWQMVQKNDFDVRAQAIADEIAAARPDLVGLQEVFTWRIQPDGDFLAGNPVPNATTVVYDFLASLQDALAARGLRYEVAASLELSDIEAPILKPGATPQNLLTADVRMTDHDVILARADVKTANDEGHVYADLLTAPLAGAAIPIQRGWVSVDVKHQGEWFRFVSTHTEAYDAAIRTKQIEQLVSQLDATQGRLILVGDLNSRPDDAGYAALRDACLGDAWIDVHGGDPGYTSGWAEDLTRTTDPVTGEPLSLSERIDLVMFRGAVSASAASIVGSDLSDRVGGLWPSDHAGVVATLRLEDPTFFTPPACD